MWILTYVGALFNGLTLLILGKSPLTVSLVPSAGTVKIVLFVYQM